MEGILSSSSFKRGEAGLPASRLSNRQVQAGQALLEILLAFGVSIMVLSAIIIVVITSLSNALFAKNQNLANSYAKEGISTVRQIRDSSGSYFSSKAGNFCLSQSSILLTNPPCGLNVARSYSREVGITHNSLDCSNGGINGSKVTVKVSWSDSKCPAGNLLCHKVELLTCLSNIDQKLAP